MNALEPSGFSPPEPPIALVACQPEIPGNLGAMIRLCACFGAPAHVVEPCGFAFSVKALRRSAMDYAQRVDVARHDDWAAFHRTRPPGRLVLFSTKGAQALWDIDFRPGDHLVFGSESAGVGAEVWASVDLSARIPIRAGERSLNVAAAAAIALAHATRTAALNRV